MRHAFPHDHSWHVGRAVRTKACLDTSISPSCRAQWQKHASAVFTHLCSRTHLQSLKAQPCGRGANAFVLISGGLWETPHCVNAIGRATTCKVPPPGGQECSSQSSVSRFKLHVTCDKLGPLLLRMDGRCWCYTDDHHSSRLAAAAAGTPLQKEWSYQPIRQKELQAD